MLVESTRQFFTYPKCSFYEPKCKIYFRTDDQAKQAVEDKKQKQWYRAVTKTKCINILKPEVQASLFEKIQLPYGEVINIYNIIMKDISYPNFQGVDEDNEIKDEKKEELKGPSLKYKPQKEDTTTTTYTEVPSNLLNSLGIIIVFPSL